MKLWLIRHAKSDWNSGVSSDFERPLNHRGERDGPIMAAWLAAGPDPATWIWTSDAARALATTAFVARGFAAADPEIVAEHRLYGATPETIVEVLRATPAEVESVALVAHNPGLTEALNLLVGEHVTDNLPTFGVARLNVPGPWESLGFSQASVDLVTGPKRLDQRGSASGSLD